MLRTLHLRTALLNVVPSQMLTFGVMKKQISMKNNVLLTTIFTFLISYSVYGQIGAGADKNFDKMPLAGADVLVGAIALALILAIIGTILFRLCVSVSDSNTLSSILFFAGGTCFMGALLCLIPLLLWVQAIAQIALFIAFIGFVIFLAYMILRSLFEK